jgi:hypothetical protein
MHSVSSNSVVNITGPEDPSAVQRTSENLRLTISWSDVGEHRVNLTGVAVPALAHSTLQCQAVQSMVDGKTTKARFFEPMLLLATGSLPDGDEREHKLKLKGYRAISRL